MSAPLFRFVHASNLALDRFCAADHQLPAGLGKLLIDAPFRAADRVFQAAIDAQAAMILLAGGTFQGEEPSTWGSSYLARQCARVAQHGIAVVWVEESQAAFRRWPPYIARPTNLIQLAGDQDARRLLSLGGSGVEITAGPAGFNVVTSSVVMDASVRPFRLTVLTGHQSPPPQPAGRPDYVATQRPALGTVAAIDSDRLHCAGTPQPRSAHDDATGSCLLVEVGRGYSVGTRRVETSSLRWHTAEITCDDTLNWEGFRRQLHSRTDQLVRANTAEAIVVRCHVSGHGPVLDRVMSPDTCALLENELDLAWAGKAPSLLTLRMTVAPDSVQEARWQREASEYGQFIRTLDDLPIGNATHVDLSQLHVDQSRQLAPAESHVNRPHFQSSLRHLARRQAAQLLDSSNR
ncbi:MAG: hypothetical protein R3B90_01960 [Planctomycetaceae bacterium]